MEIRAKFEKLYQLLQLDTQCALYDVVDGALAAGNASIALFTLSQMHNSILANQTKVEEAVATMVCHKAVSFAKTRARRPKNIAENEFDYQNGAASTYNQMVLYDRQYSILYAKMETMLQEYYERLVVFEARSQAYYALVMAWALSDEPNPLSPELRAAMRAAGSACVNAEEFCDAYAETLSN